MALEGGVLEPHLLKVHRNDSKFNLTNLEYSYVQKKICIYQTCRWLLYTHQEVIYVDKTHMF